MKLIDSFIKGAKSLLIGNSYRLILMKLKALHRIKDNCKCSVHWETDDICNPFNDNCKRL